MKQETFYCLVLSEGQARFLATSKYGIDRMKALVSLIEMAATAEKDFQIKGFSTTVLIGQVAVSEVELSHLWNCTRKTVAKILERMNQMGLVSTVKTNRTSIHTLLCVSAWQVGGVQVRNPFYVPMKKRVAEDTARTHAVGGTGAPSSIIEGGAKAGYSSGANSHTQDEVMSSNSMLSFYGAVCPGNAAVGKRQKGDENIDVTEEYSCEVNPADLPSEAELEAMLNDTAEMMMADDEGLSHHPGAILHSPDGAEPDSTSLTPDE